MRFRSLESRIVTLFLVLKLVDTAKETERAAGISIVGNNLYQIVVVPVKAPVVIGWVAMAFPVDQRIAADMRALSSLHVSVLTKDQRDNWVQDASTLPAADAASLAQQLSGTHDDAPPFRQMRLGDSDFSARVLPLAQDAQQTSIVVLQRSKTKRSGTSSPTWGATMDKVTSSASRCRRSSLPIGLKNGRRRNVLPNWSPAVFRADFPL